MFVAPAALSLENTSYATATTWIGSWVGPQGQYGCFVEAKSLLPRQRIETLFLGRPLLCTVHSLSVLCSLQRVFPYAGVNFSPSFLKVK